MPIFKFPALAEIFCHIWSSPEECGRMSQFWWENIYNDRLENLKTTLNSEDCVENWASKSIIWTRHKGGL